MKVRSRHPKLARAYALKEAFYAFHEQKLAPDAEIHLDAWLASLDPEMRLVFKELVTALANWRAEIVAYWASPERPTNALAESLNAKIKRINSAGGGYMPFALLRSRVVHGEPRRRAREERREAARKARRGDRERKRVSLGSDNRNLSDLRTGARMRCSNASAHADSDGRIDPGGSPESTGK